MLSSEFITIPNPLQEDESVTGLCLLNQHLIIHGSRTWVRYSTRGELEDTKTVIPKKEESVGEEEQGEEWQILSE